MAIYKYIYKQMAPLTDGDLQIYIETDGPSYRWRSTNICINSVENELGIYTVRMIRAKNFNIKL